MCAQMMRKLIRPAIQLFVRKLFIFETNRYRAGGALDLGLKELMNTESVRLGDAAIVPLHQEMPLRIGQKLQLRQMPTRRSTDCLQHNLEVSKHTGNRREIE
jgi:hypothetical protein